MLKEVRERKWWGPVNPVREIRAYLSATFISQSMPLVRTGIRRRREQLIPFPQRRLVSNLRRITFQCVPLPHGPQEQHAVAAAAPLFPQALAVPHVPVVGGTQTPQALDPPLPPALQKARCRAKGCPRLRSSSGVFGVFSIGCSAEHHLLRVTKESGTIWLGQRYRSSCPLPFFL